MPSMQLISRYCLHRMLQGKLFRLRARANSVKMFLREPQDDDWDPYYKTRPFHWIERGQ